MPRCALIARCGACSVAPAHCTTRSMSAPGSAAVFTSSVCSAWPRQTVTRTCSLSAAARSTSRNRVTTLPSIASTRSPGCSSCAASRAADQAHHGERLAAPSGRVAPSCAASSSPAGRFRARCASGKTREFGFERMQRPLAAHAIEHVGHQIDRHAAVVLGDFAPVLVGEARPSAEHVARLIGEHAVELERRIDELRGLDVAVAEAHGARQRQLQRIDARDLGAARAQLAVAAQAHHPHPSRRPGSRAARAARTSPASCR